MEPALSKHNRLKVYKELLDIVCRDPKTHYGFCYYIDQAPSFVRTYLNSRFWMTIDVIKYELPELYSLKPARTWEINTGYWFAPNVPGWNRRIKLLWQMINKMEKELQISN